MSSNFALSFLVLCFVVGCSSLDQSDQVVSPQKRRDFEELKFSDPSLGKIPDGIRVHEHAFVQSMVAQLDKGEQTQSFGAFRQIGPFNIGGRTRALAFDINNPSILLAGGVSGGLWRSENAGATWSLVTKPNDLHTISCITQDPRPGKTHNWYYGTGEVYGNSADISGNGIFTSSDNGKTWVAFPSTVSASNPASHPFAYAWRIVVDPIASTDVILVATNRAGIYRTSNGGANWTSIVPTNSYFSDIVVTPSGVFYAALSVFTGYTGQNASKWGVHRSVDGISWKNITPADMPATSTWRIVLGLVGQSTTDVYAIAETPGVGTKGSFHLRDGTREQWHSLWKYHANNVDTNGVGGVWDNRSASIPLFGGRNGDYFTQGGYDMHVRASPADSNVVFLGGTNLYRSTDGFRTNQQLSYVGGYGAPTPGVRYTSYPNHHPDQHDVVFHPTQPSVLWSANDGGVMRTDNYLADSVQWVDLNRGYYTTQHYAIAIRDTANDNNVMGGMQDNGTWETSSNDSTFFWINRNGGDGAYCAYADSGRTIYVSTQTARITRVLLDANGTEISRTRIDPIGPLPDDYLFINPFVVDPADQNIMYLPAGPILYRNNDLSGMPMGHTDSTGVNWDSLPATNTGGSPITSIAVTKTGHTVYYGTQSGKLRKLENANVGQPTPTQLLSGSGTINNISVHPTNADKIVACFSNYGVISMYATQDGGATWSAISGNLEENNNGSGNGPAVSWVAIYPYDNNVDVLVAATTSGLFFTTQLNGMSTVWSRIAETEIGNVPTDMVLARASDKEIFVGTHGRGVFRGRITSLPTSTAPPTLRSPADLTKGVHLDTVLKWSKVTSAVSYSIELATSEDFLTEFERFDGIRTDSITIYDLKQGPITYYWRVFAFGEGGRSTPSETWTFSTAVRPPVLLIPTSNAVDVPGLPVSLTWSRIPEALRYDVEVANNLTFSQIVAHIDNVIDTTAFAGGLESNKRYFWHVRSADNDATGIWSQRSSFTTGLLTSISDDNSIGTQLSISPNPANTQLNIAITKPWGSATVVEFVDVSGRLLLRETLTSHRATIDVRSLPIGEYQIRVHCDKQILTSSVRILR